MMKKSRWIGFFLSLLTIFTVLGLHAQRVSAADVTDKAHFEDLKITVADTGDDSKAIHSAGVTQVELKLSGKFSFPNVAVNEIKDGDYFIQKVPENLTLKDEPMDLMDTTSNTKMGTVQADIVNHQLKFTFNDKIKDKQHIRGEFVTKAVETVTDDKKTVTYEIPGGKTQTITYTVKNYTLARIEGEVITKYGNNDKTDAKAYFEMKINRSKSDMGNHVVKIVDDISQGAFANYIESSFRLSEAEYQTTDTTTSGLKQIGKRYEITTDPAVYQADSDNKALLTYTNGKRGFELLMPTNMGTKSFYLKYWVTSPADSSVITNSVQYLIDNQPQLVLKKYNNSISTKKIIIIKLKTVQPAGATVKTDIAGKIIINKYDAADSTVKLKGVEFEIFRKSDNKSMGRVTTDENGVAHSPVLADGTYIVKETAPLAGYELNTEEFEVEMKGEGVPLNIPNKRKTTDFEATKTWKNGKASDYKEVKLALYAHKEDQTLADAKPVTGTYKYKVTENKGVYTYKWENQLPERDVDGKKLVYSVREVDEKTGLPLQEGDKVQVGDNSYVVSYNGNNKVTNTYEVPKTKVVAKKIWQGGKADTRPTVYFKLYRAIASDTQPWEVAGQSKKEIPKTDGTVEWDNLPATNDQGEKYTYSVLETDNQGNEFQESVDGYTPEKIDDVTITNKYQAKKAKVGLSVSKDLINETDPDNSVSMELQGDEFEFTLTDQNGAVKETAKNDKNGNVRFKELTFDAEGTYTYTIKEVKAGTTENGYTYTDKTVTATVTVVDDGKGTLKATVAYDDETPFENTYKSLPAKADIEVGKDLLGGRPTALQADEFEFILQDENGNELQRAKNDVDGRVIFKDVPFTEDKTYHYTVVEANAGQTIDGVTYDARKVKVTVYVGDNGRGQLIATPTYDRISAVTVPYVNFTTPSVGGELALPPGAISVTDNGGIQRFENTYKAEKAKARLSVKKSLINVTDPAAPASVDLQGGEFEFTLTDADGVVKDTAKNDKDGNVQFPELEFTKADTYTYTIKEVKAGTTADGITYDGKTVTATVTVEDDSKGHLVATVAYTSDAVDGDTTFTNTYSVEKTSAALEVTKKLTGRKLKADEFEFTLTDADGTVKGTAKNDKDGNVQFPELEFTKADTYLYTITEKNGGTTVDGITYDGKTVTATVTVTDDGKGVLSATVAYDGDTTFTNTYTPAADTSVTLGAKKVLEGKKLEAGKYSFVLKEGENELQTVTNAADGTVTFAPITYNESQVGPHKYTISEVAGNEAGVTYDTTVHEVEVTVDKVSATELKATVSKEAKDLVFTNTYTPAKTEVKVAKVWDDANNQDGKRPASITVKLLADGVDTGKTLDLSEANGWTGSFTELDAAKGGKTIDYKVVEATGVTGYTTVVTGDAAAGFTITNSYKPETVDIKATKNWDDGNNQDGKRPTKIVINLLANGEKVDSKEVQAAADGTWTAEFKEKAKYKDGKEIKYTVTEETVAEYEATINDFNIINKYIPKAIEYKVTKVWNDANNQDGKRPASVTVQLYKSVNGSEVAVAGKTLTITADGATDANTWVASFTNLPQFENGQEIVYSVKEVNVPEGYEASASGQVVTNSHAPETIVISGTKVWDDNNNQDGKRTASVKIQILNGDDTVVQEMEVSEATGWAFESTALPKYKDGQEIAYKVKEIAVASYETEITKTTDGKYTVTNKLTPAKTAVSGQKIWNDGNNQDSIRPDTILVKLYANGQDTGKTAVASEATGWKYEFTGLDRYQDGGKEIAYTVKEAYVPHGYTSEVIGTNLVNHHKPKDPEPNKPNKPKDPEPGKPQNPGSHTPGKPNKPKGGKNLPSTGEEFSSAAVVGGLALMGAAGGLYYVSRKKR